MNVGKSKVVRCSRYVKMGRMHERQIGEPRKWIVLSTWVCNGQRMQDVNVML